LVVLTGILAVGAATVYASLGGSRERARQAVCMSNLRQIGRAIAMYRQDYGGTDTPGWPAQMGLPPLHTTLVGLERQGGEAYLPGGRQVLFCQDDLSGGRAASSYGWNTWEPDDHRVSCTIRPSFPAVIARRGGAYPLVYDTNHSLVRPDRAPSLARHIVLCLDGRVQTRFGDGPSWEW